MALVQTGTRSIETIEGETLLETLERAGYQVEYQCRQGYCGSCRTKMVMGEVEYNRHPLAYINPGEVLPCCCQAKGKILLDIQEPSTDTTQSK